MSEQQRKLICTRCPMGCEMEVLSDDKGGLKVNGSVCKLGKEYAKDEITNPTRTITSTVKVKNGVYLLVPVRTTKPVPKNRIKDVMKELRNILSIKNFLLEIIFFMGAKLQQW